MGLVVPYDFNVDFSPLATLSKLYRDAQQQAQIDAVRQQVRDNPDMDLGQAARLFIGAGGTQEGGTLASIYNQAQQRALADKQLAETSRHNTASEGLTGSSQTETARHNAALETQAATTPIKLGADISGDIYGTRSPAGGFQRIDASTLPLAGQPPPITGPRPGGPIPSSPTVMGDKEAEAAGLYEPSKAPLTAAQKASLSGDAYLQTLPPDMQGLVKKIANYDYNPKTLTARGQRDKIMAAVMQYDPTYNEQEYDQRALTTKRFASGPQGDTLRSMNVGIDHLSTLQQYADALANGNVQLINAAANKFKEQFGYDAPTNFNAVKAIVGNEVSKAIIGARGALADREETKQALTTANSPAQISGVIQAYKKLMAGQVNGLRQQYESSGLKDFNKKLLPATLKELGMNADGTAATPQSSGPVDWQTYFGNK